MAHQSARANQSRPLEANEILSNCHSVGRRLLTCSILPALVQSHSSPCCCYCCPLQHFAAGQHLQKLLFGHVLDIYSSFSTHLQHSTHHVMKYAICGSIVFGPIQWCVWSFRPSTPLRLPHLKFLFVCLVCMCFQLEPDPVEESMLE